MAREQLPYYDPVTDGPGLEGFINWSNKSMDYFMIPAFLLVFYILGIYFVTKNTEYKQGGYIMLVSLVFFILGMIAQTFTEFDQLVIFIFALGFGVGAVMSFIENS
jgi:uncharacterized membrane protein